MKTLAKEIRLLPNRTQVRNGGYIKTLTKEICSLPDRALFWVGVALLTSGVLKVEELPE